MEGTAVIAEAQVASAHGRLPSSKEGGLQRTVNKAIADVRAWLDSGDEVSSVKPSAGVQAYSCKEDWFAHCELTMSSIKHKPTVESSEFIGCLMDEIFRD